MGKCGRIPLVVFTEGNVNMAFNKNEYDQQYKKDHFERMEVLLPKGTKEKFKDYAKAHDISVGELVRQAVEEKMNR